MTDDAQQIAPASEHELNVGDPSSVAAWAELLGTSERLLRLGVAAVGCDLRALRIHLARRAPWQLSDD